jgi:hypothetical protein
MNFTAIEAQRRENNTRYSWVRLFDGLRDWIRVRGVDQLTDDALKALEPNMALEWQVGPQMSGPQALVLQTFREDAELWLSACPADEGVVIVPREIFERIIAALPPLDGPLTNLPMLSADEWARQFREQLAAHAGMRRHYRERAERERGTATAKGD